MGYRKICLLTGVLLFSVILFAKQKDGGNDTLFAVAQLRSHVIDSTGEYASLSADSLIIVLIGERNCINCLQDAIQTLRQKFPYYKIVIAAKINGYSSIYSMRSQILKAVHTPLPLYFILSADLDKKDAALKLLLQLPTPSALVIFNNLRAEYYPQAQLSK